jgi:transcriptional regulator with XRE-family HTH domain
VTASPARYCHCGTRLARDNPTDICGPCQRRAQALALGAPDVPAAFWSGSDQVRDALDAWHMGRVIAAFRSHPHHGAPLSQETVAGWMGLTQTQLSRIESGEPITDLTKLIRWAETLRIPEDLLWFKLPGSGPTPAFPSPAHLDRLEQLRQRATGTLTTGAMSAAGRAHQPDAHQAG